MRNQKKTILIIISFMFLLLACGTSNNANSPTDMPENVGNNSNSVTPIATVPPPTEVPTEVPIAPTIAPAMEILEGLTDDWCYALALNTGSWESISVGYTGGSDPFFQIHSIADEFFFNIELYTVYGAGWTGQTGTFDPTCTANGICIYFIPDTTNSYLATQGDVTITDLTQEGGAIQSPIRVLLENISLDPYPGSGSTGCYYIDSLEFDLHD